MKKIPSLFLRDKSNPKVVTRDVDPECKWVTSGEGIATMKWDGSACMIWRGRLYRRHEHKSDKGAAPTGWVHCSLDWTQRSGHGWVPVGDSPSDRYHVEAFDYGLPDGTYELVGPQVQGNPYGLDKHRLYPHGRAYLDAPRTYDDLAEWLVGLDGEGIVWHHDDGRMAKAKRRDFGLYWPGAEWGNDI